VQALRDLLDNPDRDDWDELLAANRALTKAIAKNKPMTRNNARIGDEGSRRRSSRFGKNQSAGTLNFVRSLSACRARQASVVSAFRVSVALARYDQLSAPPLPRLLSPCG
jgi:hypothetical protein